MMQMRDWVSGGVGLVVFSFGLLPILGKLGIGPEWFNLVSLPVQVLGYIAALAGAYLVMNSIIEITNSNIIGWWSFITAALITAVGLLNVLGQFGKVTGLLAMEWVTQPVFQAIFIVLGVFLMIATVAMEL